MFAGLLQRVRENRPLVHAITNYVTVNDCANIALACGGSPIMADDAKEVVEITSLCSALVLNIGTLNARTVDAMLLAGRRAKELGRPVVLDPVGAGASALRTRTAVRLLREVRPSILRGNLSEIRALAAGGGTTRGVDADTADAVTEETLSGAVDFVRRFAGETGAVVAATGAIDIVADGARVYLVRNGHPMMSRITGTGCMLSEVVACFAGANPDRLLESTAAAVAAMGLCGELAWADVSGKGGGTASLRAGLIDRMSLLDGETLARGMKIECAQTDGGAGWNEERE